MELGAGGNLLFIPRHGECLWYLRRFLKEVKVCELSALWRKALQIADTSSNALRHECAIVWGGVRQPAWLEWENEGQRGGGCHRKPGTSDTGRGALLGLWGISGVPTAEWHGWFTFGRDHLLFYNNLKNCLLKGWCWVVGGRSEKDVDGGLDQTGQGGPARVERNGGLLDIFWSHH